MDVDAVVRFSCNQIAEPIYERKPRRNTLIWTITTVNHSPDVIYVHATNNRQVFAICLKPKPVPNVET